MSDYKSNYSKSSSLYLVFILLLPEFERAKSGTRESRPMSAIIENTRAFSIPCDYRVYLFSSWFSKPMKLVLCGTSALKLRVAESFWIKYYSEHAIWFLVGAFAERILSNV